MINIIEYNTNTGEIERSFTAENMADQSTNGPEYALLEVGSSEYGGNTHWVNELVEVVAYSAASRISKETLPMFPAEWSNTTMSWEPLGGLASIKAIKRRRINEWRMQANYSGFIHGGKLIASDQLSMLDITNTANEINQTNSLPVNWPGAWKAVDNSYIPITTIQDWRAFFSSMYQQGLNNFMISQQLKTLVDTATTVAEVDAIVWPT